MARTTGARLLVDCLLAQVLEPVVDTESLTPHHTALRAAARGG
jgi:hypothetical protein